MKRLFTSITLVLLFCACLPKQPLGQICYIDSIPPEAQVYSMGKLFGQTPIELELPPGATITISKSGYREEKVDPKSISAGYALIKLEKLYQLKLNYTPEGSEVWEDGKLVGKTPLIVDRIAGKAKFLIRHEFHNDLVDEFIVDGDTYRLKTLKPSIKYFPNTICSFQSKPNGVQVDNYSIEKGVVLDRVTQLGTTPFEMSNGDLSKHGLEHLFVFKKDGFSPRILTGNGSFFAYIEMTPQEQYEKANGIWVSSLEYKTGEITSPSKSYTLWAVERDKKLAIISKKSVDVEVDILDMKTDFTDVSGSAWLDDRFFVVRAKNAFDGKYYIVYDAIARRRFRIENAGFWHEAYISGSIEWKLQIPIKPSQIEDFSDIIIQTSKNYSVATFRLFDGKPLEFTVIADTLFNKPKLVGIDQ